MFSSSQAPSVEEAAAAPRSQLPVARYASACLVITNLTRRFIIL